MGTLRHRSLRHFPPPLEPLLLRLPQLALRTHRSLRYHPRHPARLQLDRFTYFDSLCLLSNYPTTKISHLDQFVVYPRLS